MPAAIADIGYQNKAAIYGILFKASAEAALTIAADPKRLGAKIGITALPGLKRCLPIFRAIPTASQSPTGA